MCCLFELKDLFLKKKKLGREDFHWSRPTGLEELKSLL